MRIFMLTVVAICWLTVTSSAAVLEDRMTVYFESDSYELSEESRSAIDQFLLLIGNGLDFELEIKAHTDADGSNQYNKSLSIERAESVRSYFLSKHFLERQTIVLDAFGEMRPQASNLKEMGKRANRRVEITLRRYLWESIEEVNSALAPNNISTHTLDPSCGDEIVTDDGVILSIPENAFVNANGEMVIGDVKLEITNAMSHLEWVKEGLSCESDGVLLESGGMLKLEAYDSDGRSLRVRDGRSIDLMLPVESNTDGMSVFTSQNGQNWANSSIPFDTETVDYQVPRMPIPPRMLDTRYVRPTYEPDMSKYPKKPPVPIRPREPRLIEASELRPAKKRDREKYQQINQNRMVRIDLKNGDRVSRYNRMLKEFQEDSASLPVRLALYETELKNWENLNEMRNKSFNATAILRYDSLYNERAKNVERAYRAELELYYAKIDSIEQLRLREIELRFAKFEGKGINPRDLQFYAASVTQMGWINCDRFTDPNVVRDDIYVQLEQDHSSTTVLRFKDINSMMRLNVSEDGMGFFNIPKDSDAEIISYKLTENGVELARSKPNFEFPVALVYKPCSLLDLREALAS